ncbi:hypothetical protein TURU_005067 [Turdus rufiventris]|nr:hypothetical protein TURU_005067 [Turdus rufiventris]
MALSEQRIWVTACSRCACEDCGEERWRREKQAEDSRSCADRQEAKQTAAHDCTLSKFADTRLCGAVDMLEGRTVIQRDLRSFERWDCANLMTFYKAKSSQGQDNPKCKYRLDGKWIESNSEEKDQGVLVEEKLNMTWHCALTTQKASSVLGCIQGSVAREEIPPFCSALVRPLECCIQLWGPRHGKDVDLLE